MYIISKILYKESYLRVIFESAEAFDLPIKIEYTAKLSSGTEIDEDEFEILKKESEDYTTLQLAVKYSSSALRPEKKVCDYLKKKECNLVSINRALEKLHEYGFIDDKKCAENLLLSLLRRKIVGRIYAEHTLLQKGIERSIAKSAIKKADEVFDDFERIYSFAEKKYNTFKRKKNIYSRLSSSLRTRGFDTATILEVLQRMKKEGYEFKE